VRIKQVTPRAEVLISWDRDPAVSVSVFLFLITF